jgi:hypothetical protein
MVCGDISEDRINGADKLILKIAKGMDSSRRLFPIRKKQRQFIDHDFVSTLERSSSDSSRANPYCVFQ